jgi:hypothetical protein
MVLSDEIGEIVTMILGKVHSVFVGNFNPVLTQKTTMISAQSKDCDC